MATKKKYRVLNPRNIPEGTSILAKEVRSAPVRVSGKAGQTITIERFELFEGDVFEPSASWTAEDIAYRVEGGFLEEA